MITWGARYFLSLSLLSYAAASVYGIVTGGNIIGTLSMGYKNGVGEHLGYGICVALAFGFAVMAVVAIITREGIVTDNEGIHTPVAPVERSAPSFAPPLTALALALVAAGVAISPAFLVAGLVLGAVTGVQWALQAWSDSVSDDLAVANEVKSRVSGSLDVPITALALIGFIVVGISRVLLSLPPAWATGVASAVAAVVFFGAVFIAKKNPSRNFVVSALTVLALAVFVGGIVAAGIGERSFDHGDESHSSSSEAVEE